MSVVYVVQEPLRDGKPLFDLSPAREFGRLITCLKWSDTRNNFSEDELMSKLHECLADFCDSDYLLLTGNPAAMVAAALVACEVNDGYVNLLTWQRQGETGSYRVIPIDLSNLPQLDHYDH